MASISIPCPKCAVTLMIPQASQNPISKQQQMASVSSSKHLLLLAASARTARLQGPKQIRFPILKSQIHEGSSDGSSNASPLASSKLETEQSALSETTISQLMAEVSDLVNLVDSKDIMELKLKQLDCELIIRKKEAFAPPSAAAPAVMMQPPQQTMLPPQPPASRPSPASTPLSTPASPPPSPSTGSRSSLPPLKCPMAGTFYRCPAPGEPPFVKVGDKVQKGQVVCIIEAMKLMNEIEADQSGTVVEILAEDGKPVSVDMPLLIIQP